MKAIWKVVQFLGLLGLVVAQVALAQDASEQRAQEVQFERDESGGSDPLDVKKEQGSEKGRSQSHEKPDDVPDFHDSLIDCDCSMKQLRRTTRAPCSCEKLFSRDDDNDAVNHASRTQQGFPGGPVPQSPESHLLPPPPRDSNGFLASRRGISDQRRLGLGTGFGRGFYGGGGYYPPGYGGNGYGGYPEYGWGGGYPGYYGYGYGYPGFGFGIYF